MRKTFLPLIFIISNIIIGFSNQNDVDKMLASPEIERKAKAALLFENGIKKYNLGDKKRAIPDFNQSISLDPKNPSVYSNRGLVKSKLGDKKGAIADFDQVVSLDPKDAIAYYNRGLAKSDLGDNQVAIADWDEAISLDPKLVQAYVRRGGP